MYSDLHFPTWLHDIVCVEIAECLAAGQTVTIADVNDANQTVVSYTDLYTIIHAATPSTACLGYHMRINNVFIFIRKYIIQQLLRQRPYLFTYFYNGLLSRNPITHYLARYSCQAWGVCEGQYPADFSGLRQPQCTLARAWRDPFWEHDWDCFLGNGCKSTPLAFHCMRTTTMRYLVTNIDYCQAIYNPCHGQIV